MRCLQSPKTVLHERQATRPLPLLALPNPQTTSQPPLGATCWGGFAYLRVKNTAAGAAEPPFCLFE